MSMFEARRLITRSAGLLLDTNILLLRTIHQFGADVARQRKVQPTWFDHHAFALLQRIESTAPRIVTTPHVLAETSNLLKGYLSDRYLQSARVSLLEQVVEFRESHARLVLAKDRPDVLARFGIADWGLFWFASRYTILTIDLRLHDLIRMAGRKSLNFNTLYAESLGERKFR